MADEVNDGPIPEGFEDGLADEVQAVLDALWENPRAQVAGDLEERIHPLAEKFIAGLDARPEFAEADLTPEQRQFLYCASQVAASRLYNQEEMLRLPVNTYLHFAVMAMVGWQACKSASAGEVILPHGGQSR